MNIKHWKNYFQVVLLILLPLWALLWASYVTQQLQLPAVLLIFLFGLKLKHRGSVIETEIRKKGCEVRIF